MEREKMGKISPASRISEWTEWVQNYRVLTELKKKTLDVQIKTAVKTRTDWESQWIESYREFKFLDTLKLADLFIDTLSPSDKLLDIGTGNARIPLILVNPKTKPDGKPTINSRKGGLIIGIDIDDSRIYYCNKNLGVLGFIFFQMNGRKMAFPDNSFDAITAVGVLDIIERQAGKRLVKEAVRVLGEEGKICLVSYELDPAQDERYKKDQKITGEYGTIVKYYNGKPLYKAIHRNVDEGRSLLIEAGIPRSSIRVVEDATESEVIEGEGRKKRLQFNIWGTKPGQKNSPKNKEGQKELKTGIFGREVFARWS